MRSGSGSDDAAALRRLAIVNYVFVLVLIAGSVDPGRLHGAGAWFFVVAGVISYPALYVGAAMLPAVLAAVIAGALERREGARGQRLALQLAHGLAVVGITALILIVYADARIYGLFGFHLNGFVWNLIATPGGLASMGASRESFVVAAFIAMGVGAAELGLDRAMCRPRQREGGFGRRRWEQFAAVFLSVVLAGESIAYGWSDLYGYRPILREASIFPLFVPLRFKSLARRFGVAPGRSASTTIAASDSSLAYPLAPIRRAAPERDWNVLWLCAESLRADMLDPQIMPATWALAARSSNFMSHVSGGNGTRMGVFSMFYGLPGSDWFSFLAERRGPVLIDLALDAGYRVAAFTSDDFSYPEFSQTVWARLPANRLHEYEGRGRSWERDRMNVADVEAFIEKGDAARPFFVFSFLESSHAPYDFPPDSVVRENYVHDLNYVLADFEGDIAEIRNRYVNAVHHLDTQIGRLVDFLVERGLFEDTVVIVTGDHGEEFMEQGRWGHNSSASEPQIRVPLVIHVPGRSPQRVTRLTSHLDLPATVMHLLGATNSPQTFSVGMDLFGSERRHHALIADWDTITWLDARSKARFSMARTHWVDDVRDRADHPLGPERADAVRRIALRDTLRDLSRFRRPL